jgi:hypothetical protein
MLHSLYRHASWELSPTINMSDVNSTAFPDGHRGGVSSVVGLGGPFHNPDVPALSKRQHVVRIPFSKRHIERSALIMEQLEARFRGFEGPTKHGAAKLEQMPQWSCEYVA